MTSTIPVTYLSFGHQNQHFELRSEAKERVSDGGARCYSLCPIPFGRWAIKSLSLQSGGLKVFTQPQCTFKVTTNCRLQAPGLLLPTDQGRNVCTEDEASKDSCEDAWHLYPGESHILNTPSWWEKPLSRLIWTRCLVLLLSCLTAWSVGGVPVVSTLLHGEALTCLVIEFSSYFFGGKLIKSNSHATSRLKMAENSVNSSV